MKRIGLVLLLTGASALAQQPASPCQVEERTLQRYKALLQEKIVAPQQVAIGQEAYAQCQAMQAQLAAIKAQENAAQARLDELRTRYKDTFPDVVLERSRLNELRAQESALARAQPRTPDAPALLKQASGGLQTDLPDRWWKNPATAQSLGLTADQQKKMEDVFQQYRLRLIDLNAALEKDELSLEPLVATEPLDESKITAQIDRVAQARAELEKANGRMLLGIRKMLAQNQWNKLQRGTQ
jgi:Spy/CpxP family protein refolding chaperone